jgi:integrase
MYRTAPVRGRQAAAPFPCTPTSRQRWTRCRPRARIWPPPSGRFSSPSEGVRLWFHRLYTSLKMDGCSSHSGRRTFITRAARKVSQVGGSLRDVQELAGHTSLAMTQRYIEGDTEAKRKLVALL